MEFFRYKFSLYPLPRLSALENSIIKPGKLNWQYFKQYFKLKNLFNDWFDQLIDLLFIAFLCTFFKCLSVSLHVATRGKGRACLTVLRRLVLLQYAGGQRGYNIILKFFIAWKYIDLYPFMQPLFVEAL